MAAQSEECSKKTFSQRGRAPNDNERILDCSAHDESQTAGFNGRSSQKGEGSLQRTRSTLAEQVQVSPVSMARKVGRKNELRACAAVACACSESGIALELEE